MFLILPLASLLWLSSCAKKIEIRELDCPLPEKTYYPKTADECFEKPCIIRLYIREEKNAESREK